MVCARNVDYDYIIYRVREGRSQSRVTQPRKSRAKSFPYGEEALRARLPMMVREGDPFSISGAKSLGYGAISVSPFIHY